MSTDTTSYSDFGNPAADAFDSAEGYYLQGELLEPFSGRRRRIAERLGLRFFGLMGTPEWDDFAETRTYRGFEDDMVLVLWLCSVSKERCARARRFPDRAADERDDWADDLGIFPGGPGHQEACETFSQIIADILNSILSAADAPAGEEDEDAPGKAVSEWALFELALAEATGHPVEFCGWEIPYARALQFIAAHAQRHGREMTSPAHEATQIAAVLGE